MYNIKQIIEQAPRDYSPSNWIEFCNRLPSHQAIAWQFGPHYLDEADAQQICFDCYLQRILSGKLDVERLRTDYKGPHAMLIDAYTLGYEVHLLAILSTLRYRLGFTYSGNNPIHINDDDYIKRNFAPSNIPFHLPLLVNDSGTEPSVEDWFISNRILVEL